MATRNPKFSPLALKVSSGLIVINCNFLPVHSQGAIQK
jgi:hypothetical protein